MKFNALTLDEQLLIFFYFREQEDVLKKINDAEKIGRHLSISELQVDRFIDYFRERGLIYKTGGRRGSRINLLTPDGKKKIQELINSYGEDLFEELDPEKRILKRSLSAASTINITDKSKIVIFVGAGASVPSPSNIPAITNLLEELWKRGKKMGKPHIETLEKWCNERGITNIEDVLTAVYISDFAVRNPEILNLIEYFNFKKEILENDDRYYQRLRTRNVRSETLLERKPESVALFQDTLSSLFSILTATMIDAAPNKIHKTIAELFTKFSDISIITTNYDACLDEVFSSQKIPFTYLLENGPGPKYIKMHGSINWFYCDSCQKIFYPEIRKIKDAHESDVGYSVVGICRHCTSPRRPMIVPPFKFKYIIFPPLVKLWTCANELINEANIIISIGYSFSEADDYIMKMILKSISEDNTKQIVLFNLTDDAYNNLTKKIRIHVEKYNCKENIFLCNGDAVETFPIFTEKILKRIEEEKVLDDKSD